MTRRRTTLLALILALCLSAGSALGQSTAPRETRRSETIAPGIKHLEIHRGDPTDDPEGDRWIIHLLILDTRHSRLMLARAMDETVGAETSSSLASRHGALAAVNGGYFRTTGTYRGEPTGVLAMGNKILSEPFGRRSALAISNAGDQTHVVIARIDFKAEVIAEGKARFPVSDALLVFPRK